MERLKLFITLAALLLAADQSFAARQALNENASPSSKGGLNSNFSKANANFVELYSADLLKADTSCFASEAAFNACFTLDWSAGSVSSWADVQALITGTGDYIKYDGTRGNPTASVDLSAYLSKTNTTAFTPSGDYHPATKKYVDDSITAGGGYTDEQAQDAGGGMFSGNTETGITVTYNDTTGKVDFVVATQSDVNFTSTLNTKLAGIATGAEVNVNADWNSSSGDSQILNKPSTSPLTASMITGVFPTGTGAMCKDGTVGDCGIVTGTGGYTNLTEFVGQTAWRLFYADGAGDIQELALGASGTVLKSNGTSSAPTFQTDNTSAGAGYVSTPPTYSDEACTAGQYALSESYRYDCVASGNWNRTALTDWTNLTPVAPTLTSRVISANGTTLTLTGSASLSVGAGGSGGFDIDCTTAGSGITATYASGAPGTNIVYTLGSTVAAGDTCDLDYTQPGNGIEGTTGGADLASITSASVTNNSTQVASNTDTFTGADGTALATHNVNWANADTDFPVANAVINSNHVRSTGTYNLFGGRYTASTSDTSVITLVGGAASSEDNTMPVVRASATSSGYGCYFSASASGNFTAVRFRKNGAYLADGNSGTWAMASDHVMKIVASGTSPVSLSCYIDGVLVATATDSASPIASGNPGFTGYPDGNYAKSTFDNWSDQ